MCRVAFLFWVLLLAAPALLPAQIRITYGDPNERGCRIEKSALRPVIDAGNPFFSSYAWENDTKVEVARLGPARFVTITQEACKRHHIKLELAISREEARPRDPNFYPRELFMLMNRVFHNDIGFFSYKLEFEEELLKAYARAGVKERFQFHVNDRNFYCYFDGGDWGARVELEIIRLVHRETIRMPGIEAYKDDGHTHTP